MTKPSAPAPLSTAHSVVTVGPKEGSKRRVFGLGFAAAAVLMSAAALAPVDAQAQSWQSVLRSESTSAREYGRNEALRRTDGRLAEVVMVREVELRDTSRVNLGSAVGAALGVAAARDVKDSTTRNAARILLGGLGAAGGHKIQQRFSRRDAVQITVMEVGNNGRTKLTNIVQDADLQINPGDVVMLEGSGSKLRVVPLDPSFQARLRGEPVSQNVEFGSLDARRANQGGEPAPSTSRRFGR